MIYFDHTFTNDPRHRFLKKLEKLGFSLMQSEVQHPGRHFCRFIRLSQPANPRKCTYLEFVNVKPGGIPVKKPGVSFGYSRKLELHYRKLKKSGRYRPKFVHRNYDWKSSRRERRAGWNFVLFEALGFRGLFPWLTEYEPHPKRKKALKVRHSNGVFRQRGFVLELHPKGRAFLEHLLGKKLKAEHKLSCGTELHILPSKRTRVVAVVLECRNLKRFAKAYGFEPETGPRGKPCVRIKNPSGMWDILIT